MFLSFFSPPEDKSDHASLGIFIFTSKKIQESKDQIIAHGTKFTKKKYSNRAGSATK